MMARDNYVAVVADENALCGVGLLHIMETCFSYSKIYTCRNFRELAGILGQYRSRVALAIVEYDLPGMKRTEGLRRLCEAWPSIPILVTAASSDRDTVLEVLSAGGHGFVATNCSPSELENALRVTAGGQVFVSPMSENGSTQDHDRRNSVNKADLTVRQNEVLNLIATGKSNKQIAQSLGISEGTVKVHVNAAFRILGVHNRVNATTALLGLSEFAGVGMPKG